MGFTVPFRVALFSFTEVTPTDVTMGAEPGLLVDSLPLPPPPQVERRITRGNESNEKKPTFLMVPPGMEVHGMKNG